MHTMLNTLGIVQVRADQLSAGWKSWRGFGGKSLVEWIVRRVTESQRLDGVIVVAAADQRADLATMVPTDVPLFTSSRPDALGQFADALFHYSCVNVVRICLEHPFVDPVLIDRLITNAATAPNFDYIGYCTGQGQPVVESMLGCCAELCKSKAVRIADREATDAADRHNVTRYIYRHLERFQISLLPLPSELDRTDIRLALGEHEDWEHLSDICDSLGEEPDYRDIADFLANHPRMRDRMAELNAEHSALTT